VHAYRLTVSSEKERRKKEMKLRRMKEYALVSLIFIGTLTALLASVGSVHATAALLIKEHHPSSTFKDPSGTYDGYLIGQIVTWDIHLNVTSYAPNSTNPNPPYISISNLTITDTLPNLGAGSPKSLFVSYVSGTQTSTSGSGPATTFTDYGNGTLFWNFGAGPFTTGVPAPPPYNTSTVYQATVAFNATILGNVTADTYLVNSGAANYTETLTHVISTPSISDTIWVPGPVLNIVKVNPAKVDNGSSFDCVLQLSNTGYGDATGVAVQDIMPAGVTHTAGTASATSGSFITDSATNVTWSGTLFNVTNTVNTVNITIPVMANTALTSVLNNASFTAYPSNTVFTHQYSIYTTNVIHPAISLTKTANATKVETGSAVKYTYNVTNTGDTSLTVSLTDSAFGTIFTGKVMAPGTFNVTTIIQTLTANTTNIATATGVDQNGTSVTATATSFVQVIHPAISLTKTPSPSTPQIGPASFTYTYRVTNTGDTTLSGVKVYDQTFNVQITIGATTLSPGQSTTGTYGPVAYPNVTASYTDYANASGTDQTGVRVTATAQATVSVYVRVPTPTGGYLWPVNSLTVLLAAFENILVSDYWVAVPAVGVIAALVIFKRRRN
jgi:uncharacterized repeat protein (TIGR01451 family)